GSDAFFHVFTGKFNEKVRLVGSFSALETYLKFISKLNNFYLFMIQQTISMCLALMFIAYSYSLFSLITRPTRF
ncbi:hypothetical protein NPN23_24400, partial [Vibrio parahaemolyticus]|nr:hypothetical protein [Vibrio parahaemolyticus]